MHLKFQPRLLNQSLDIRDLLGEGDALCADLGYSLVSWVNPVGLSQLGPVELSVYRLDVID